MLLNTLTILSRKERCARVINLHPKTTLILGKNDTGKSSLTKSIYEAFGAEVKQTAGWSELETITAVDFTQDESKYTVLFHRKPRWYLVHEHDTDHLHLFESITNGLGPFLAKLFHFDLRLTQRQGGQLLIPPPAFQFLPFYIDQDLGWQGPWSSFERLGQFSSWKRDLIDYFVGKKPAEYFRLKSDLVNRSQDLRFQLDHFQNMESVLNAIRTDTTSFGPEPTTEEFAEEIRVLEKRLSEAANRRSEISKALLDDASRRAEIEDQLRIVEAISREIELDYQFATTKLGDSVECPTCGAQYENDIETRFELANSVEKSSSLTEQLTIELSAINTRIEENEAAVEELRSEIRDTRTLMEQRRGERTFSDYIERRAVERSNASIERYRSGEEEKVSDLQNEVDVLGSDLRRQTDRVLSTTINQKYKMLMSSSMENLRVFNLAESVFESPDRALRTSGSDLPRAVLGYFFTVAQLIRENPDAPFHPFIIDSPKQQDPDDFNQVRLFEFIRGRTDENDQLILASVSVPNTVDFETSTRIELEDPYGALGAFDLDEAEAKIGPYLNELEGLAPEDENA